MQGSVRAKSRGAQGDGRVPVLFLMKCLLGAYILTAVMLVGLAFLLFKMNLSEQPVAVAIIVIYVVATMFAGFLVGKKMQSRKFLWGLLMGAAYFIVLTVVSLAVNESPDALGNSFFTTLMLCAGGGMLGGMLS